MKIERLALMGTRLRTGTALALAALLWGAALVAQPPQSSEPIRIAMLFDGSTRDQLDFARDLRTEILALTAGELDVEFAPDSAFVGDFSAAGARRIVDRALADPDVDLLIATGVVASNELCCRTVLEKPAVATVAVDARLQGFPWSDGSSGRPNLSYVALPDPVASDLRAFHEIVPFDEVVVLVNADLLAAVPELVERTTDTVRDLGLEYTYVAVGDSVEETIRGLPADADAVYVTPLYHLSAEAFRRLVEGLIERRLPSFSLWGGDEVEAGLLAGMRSQGFEQRLIRRVALNVQRILLGEEPGSLPVDFQERGRLVINMATARAISVSPRWTALIEAELLFADDVEDREELSLPQAVAEAIAVNLDLLARRQAIAAEDQDTKGAASAFRPSIEASALGLVIDSDRAAASFGSQAERSLVGSLELSQLLFSDGANANLAIQRKLQLSREQELATLRLDIARAAALAYLDTLRAKTLVRIQDNNLALTRSNLDLARTRQQIGAANPAEVYRWESQVAIDRKSLVEARASRRAAEMALARLLHRDIETIFRTAEMSLDSPNLLVDHERFQDLIATEQSYRAFRDFTVGLGVASSPEIAQLDAFVAAGERRLLAAKRSFWAPTLGLEAAYDEILAEGGAGADAGAGLPPGLPLPQVDSSSWSLGISARLPIFRGGERTAERVASELDLESLRLQRSSLVEKIEQAIRTALIFTRSRQVGVELSRSAADAAARNLELVSDGYARGALSVIDLLDAQNAALNAEELAANSVYDFLADLVEVMRAANLIEMFLDPTAHEAFVDRFESFLEAQE